MKTAEETLDILMIRRGEHPSRVRNPIYGEERQLALDLLKELLPSDEEIKLFMNNQPYYGTCTTEYLEGINEGAQWIKNKLNK